MSWAGARAGISGQPIARFQPITFGSEPWRVRSRLRQVQVAPGSCPRPRHSQKHAISQSTVALGSRSSLSFNGLFMKFVLSPNGVSMNWPCPLASLWGSWPDLLIQPLLPVTATFRIGMTAREVIQLLEGTEKQWLLFLANQRIKTKSAQRAQS